MGELDGRIALVTGASRGIGAAVARGLAAEGARVIVTDLTAPEELAAEIGGLASSLDVTDEGDWIGALALAEEAGGLDVLVNNAAVIFLKPLTETSLQDWRRLHAVNLEGVFLGCKHAQPLLAERAERWRGGTAIINMSSAAGLVGSLNCAAYSSSKGAVRLLSKSLALELAPHGIRVNSIHPGLIETPMGDQVVVEMSQATGVAGAQVRDQLARVHPLGHTGAPANVADGVVFLASDKASFITGAEFVIDGGMTAQ